MKSQHTQIHYPTCIMGLGVGWCYWVCIVRYDWVLVDVCDLFSKFIYYDLQKAKRPQTITMKSLPKYRAVFQLIL